MAQAPRDRNRVTTLLGASSADGATPVIIYADPATFRLYVDALQDFDFKNITADSQIKASAGFLHAVIINAVTTAGVLTIYNNTAESGATIAAINLETRAAGAQVPHFLVYNVTAGTGLYAGFDATLAANITIAYR